MQTKGADEEVVLLAHGMDPNRGLLNEQARQPKPGYKDIAFSVLFGLQLVTVIGVAMSLGIMSVSNDSIPDEVDVDEDGSTDTEAGDNYSTIMIGGVFLLLSVGAALSVVWIYVMVRLAAKLIMCTLVGVIAVCLMCSILFFTSGSVAGGVVTLLFALLVGVYLYAIRKRVEFASKNLKIACSSVLTMPTTLMYALIMLGVQLVWCVLWAMAVLGVATNDSQHTIRHDGTTYDLDDCSSYTYHSSITVGDTTLDCSRGSCHACVCEKGGDDVVVYSNSSCLPYRVDGGLYFLMLISFYWTCCVISNVVHCMASGAVGSWWFHQSVGAAAVKDAFMRAVTTSFGSICFGSLLVAVIKALRQLMYQLKKASEKNARMVIIAEYLLSAVDRLLEYFNKYAFCYVALYGSSFLESGKSVTQLFRQKGWTAIINDSLIDNVLALGATVVAVVCTLIAYVFAQGMGLNRSSTAIMSLFGLFIGYVMCMVTLQVVNSAVATVFVLFAEAPEAFKYTHPELYDELVQAWTKFHGTEMVACGYAVPVDEESYAGHYAPDAKVPSAPVDKQETKSAFRKVDSFDDGDEATV